jgi:excisionase family DNA binding protein
MNSGGKLMKLLSTSECAERKGVSRIAIYKAIKRGDLAAIPSGRSFKVKQEVCDKWEPVNSSTAGKRGAASRWEGHEKEVKPKRPRGRPKKKNAGVTTLTTKTTLSKEEPA